VGAEDCALPGADACDSAGWRPNRCNPWALLGERYYRAAYVPAAATAPEGFEFTGLRRLWGRMDEGLLAVAGRAYQIAEWARTHRYCGACAPR
jgi:NAD+ diphosphatase